MKIIILGAGQVGTSLAEQLATEHNDITIVDTDDDKLRSLQERMDIQTITGHGSHPDTLKRCGAEEADMLIAVTNNDETNLVACQVAYTLYQIPTKIARIRSLQFLAHPELFGGSQLPVDVLVSPEQLVTHYIHRLIEYPNAKQVLDFAEGRVKLIALKMRENEGSMIGQTISAVKPYLPDFAEVKVPAIFRKGSPIIPDENTVIETGDEVFLLMEQEYVTDVMKQWIALDTPYRRVMIAGGGNIGTRLAASLENEFQVKVIEKNKHRVEIIATFLSNATVLHGDASDKELLLGENIEDIDVFCAVTNNDEANIMSALLAKRLGARKVMALVNRPSYLDLVETSEIDIAVSPQQATIGSLLTHVRRGHILSVHSLRRGTAEAIELMVDGDETTSKVIGKSIQEIDLPEDTVVGAVIRENQVMMNDPELIFENGDRVIVFLVDKRKVRLVERLFQEDTHALV